MLVSDKCAIESFFKIQMASYSVASLCLCSALLLGCVLETDSGRREELYAFHQWCQRRVAASIYSVHITNA